MRKHFVVLIAAIAIAIALIPSGRTEADQLFEVHYTVHYTCVCGPCPPIVGEWTLNCDGTLTGWGEQPFAHEGECHHTEVTRGDWC